jgi:thiol-disulfide isomerase/thioredoxin
MSRNKNAGLVAKTDQRVNAPRLGSWAGLMMVALLSLACEAGPPPRPVTSASASRTSSVMKTRNTERAVQAVSELAIPRPDGGTFKLADLRGKVVVVDFWATWCPPCIRQMPGLAKLGERYRAQGLEIVGLSLNNPSEDAAEVAKFIKQAGVNYTVGYADRRVSSAFLDGTEDETGTAPIPQLFVFTRDGRLVEHLIGEDPERGLQQLEQVVNQQLSLGVASS